MTAEPVRPHVLVVAPTPFFSDRGCHVRILEEVRAVEARGFRCTVCTYHLGKDVEGLPIYRSLNVPWYKKLDAGPSPHKFYLDALLLWTVLRACWRDRPDVIHAHLHEGVAVGWVASLLFRRPLVGDLQGSLVGELMQHKFIKPRGLVFRFFRACEKLILRMPCHIVLSSDRATHGVCEIDELKPPATIVTDGVDETVFTPRRMDETLRSKLRLPEDKLLVGFLGVLNEYQGASVMLESAKRVVAERPDAHFVVMGYPKVEHYQQVAADLGITEHVTFTGRVPYAESRDWLAACDIGFSAKQDVTEANGKLLNYMSVGLPTVATDTPVNRGLLGEDTAVFGAVDDPESLATATLELLNDDTMRERLGRAARERVERELSWRSGGRKLAVIYRRLLGLPDENHEPATGPGREAA